MSLVINNCAKRLIITSLAAILLGSCSATLWADGGELRLVERRDDLQIAVFTSPNPLRAGPVDISVLLQDLRTGRLIDKANVYVQLERSGGTRMPMVAPATSAAATNKLLRAAKFELPEAGLWKVNVTWLPSGKPANIQFEMDAAGPLPALVSAWLWFTWPLGVILIFGIHRALVARRPSGGRKLTQTTQRGRRQLMSAPDWDDSRATSGPEACRGH